MNAQVHDFTSSNEKGSRQATPLDVRRIDRKTWYAASRAAQDTDFALMATAIRSGL